MNEPNLACSESEATAQAQLRQIAMELEAIRFRLIGLQATLSVPPQEDAMLAGELDMDVSTEVRSVIDCVLNDSIQPAVRDLLAAAEYPARPGAGMT